MEKTDTYNAQTALWESFRSGDRGAFNELMQQYYPRLLNYGVRLGFDKTNLEDTLQDFFVNLWQRHEHLSAATNPNAYLLISFRRRLFKEKERGNRLNIVGDLPEKYDFDTEISFEKAWIIREQDHENHEQLKRQLNSLTKRQHEALYLRYYQGLNYHEIGELMGISQRSAINFVSDAIKIMRRNWAAVVLVVLATVLK
jgi:RNA polymerase sigma factor (sigma-70 family)